MNSKQAKPSIVFAHGLWADGSCFSKLIPTLQAEGHEVVAAQNSLDTFKGDVAAVTRALGRVRSPAILVGHSYGGTVITAAGTDDRVSALVYIAALAPDATETSQSQQNQFPTTDVFAHIEVADGRVWLKPDGIECFAGDLSEQEQKLVWATQGVPDARSFCQACRPRPADLPTCGAPQYRCKTCAPKSIAIWSRVSLSRGSPCVTGERIDRVSCATTRSSMKNASRSSYDGATPLSSAILFNSGAER